MRASLTGEDLARMAALERDALELVDVVIHEKQEAERETSTKPGTLKVNDPFKMPRGSE